MWSSRRESFQKAQRARRRPPRINKINWLVQRQRERRLRLPSTPRTKSSRRPPSPELPPSLKRSLPPNLWPLLVRPEITIRFQPKAPRSRSQVAVPHKPRRTRHPPAWNPRVAKSQAERNRRMQHKDQLLRLHSTLLIQFKPLLSASFKMATASNLANRTTSRPKPRRRSRRKS